MMRYSVLILLLSTFCHAAADLEISDLKTRVSEDGKSVTVQFVILNHGPDAAAAMGLRLSVYANRTLLSSGEYQMEPLSAGADHSGSVQLDATPSMTGVRAEVYDSEQADTTPSSNVREGEVKMPGGSLSDLEITEGTIVSAQPVKDKNLVIRVHLVNHGPAAVANSRAVAELMLFQKTVADTEKRPGKLSAQDERDLQFSISVPAGIPASEGVVIVRWTASDDATQDPVTANNSYSIPVSLVARRPDLVLLTQQVNSRGELVFSVKNKGNSPAPPSITAVYRNGALVKRFNTPELAAGAERRHQYGGSKILPGTQIIIIADFNADVEESSEENNRFQFVSK